MHPTAGWKRPLVALIALALCALSSSSLTWAAGPALRPLAQGTRIADLGFRPEANGFSFQNYGSETPAQNLTSGDLRRIFGDAVCASLADGGCILTPPAQQWMDQNNASMGGGHCYGFSVLSLAMYQNKIPAANFGAGRAVDLSLQNNEALQREIASSFVHQSFPAVWQGAVQGTPSELLDRLIASLQPNAPDAYTIGIFKAGGSGGHAVTPFAVDDLGGGNFDILVYDNNYPQLTRAIRVDRNANTWAYEASINPSVQADLYQGNAATRSMTLLPMSPGLAQQPCFFCQASAAASATGDRQAFDTQPQFNQVWLNAGEGAEVLVTDLEGRRIGYANGALVNEIPGAQIQHSFSDDLWADSPAPAYLVPVGIDFSITIDGSALSAASSANLLMLGPGYVLEISDIALEPGQVDTLDVSPDGDFLSYRSATGESPDMLVGIETSAADYTFLVNGFDIEPGSAVNVSLDTTQGWLSIDAIDNETAGAYVLLMSRVDDAGEQVFGSGDIVLEPNDIVYVDYLDWPGDGGSMPLDVDRGGDGSVDEVLQVADITNEIDYDDAEAPAEAAPAQPEAAPAQPEAAPAQPAPAQPEAAPAQPAPAAPAPLPVGLPNTGTSTRLVWGWLVLPAAGLVATGLHLRRRSKGRR